MPLSSTTLQCLLTTQAESNVSLLEEQAKSNVDLLETLLEHFSVHLTLLQIRIQPHPGLRSRYLV